MSDALDRLAQLAGIEEGWWDFFGVWRPVTEETKRCFLAAMGFDISTPSAEEASLRAFEERPWRRLLPPVTVHRLGLEDASVEITLADSHAHARHAWHLTLEDGTRKEGHFRPDELVETGRHVLDGEALRRCRLTLPHGLPLGYHRLAIDGGKDAGEGSLIIAPATAWQPESMLKGGRLWGVTSQLYAMRREMDWGAGDFTTLAEMCASMAKLGAGAVGVNPLHARFPGLPERISPYSPSTRLFLDILMIDPEAAPEFAAAKNTAARHKAEREAACAKELIDWPAVSQAKLPVLEKMHGAFCEKNLGQRPTARGRAYLAFLNEMGEAAERFALFQALQEHFQRVSPDMAYWRRWPLPYHNPASPECRRFAEAHARRIGFFHYLQFLADEQLGQAAQVCAKSGMAVGIYRDLGVAIAGDGAEAWSQQDKLALGVNVGAPPDPLNLKGQDWGLSPFNPIALQEAAYAPFAQVVRANMRHAGAMRLDHAMSLVRLYWVPQGNEADQGAYVRMPGDDLFAILALESQRAQCLVIGEDLGTVPDGFREKMRDTAILAYRILVFERGPGGVFKSPDLFDENALVAGGTHDLPPLLGWWRGSDLDERERLSLYPKPETAGEERRARSEDRRRLIEALAQEGMLDPLFPSEGDLSPAQAGRLLLAAYRHLDATPCRLLMVQLEDMARQVKQMNLPGTMDEHPNWRRRLALPGEMLAQDDLFAVLAQRLSATRPSVAQRRKK
jgi:4-alpha-glucanotransferase